MKRRIVRIALVAGLVVPPDERKGPMPLLVLFHYDTGHPFSITLRFLARPGHWVDWVFARDLLSDALVWGSAGDGDVRFRVHPDADHKVQLLLSSPSGRAEFTFPHRHLSAALELTERLVPWGTELDQVDWDGELAALRRAAR